LCFQGHYYSAAINNEEKPLGGEFALQILIRVCLLAVKLASIVLSPFKVGLVRLWRGFRRGLLLARAGNWPVTDARVVSSFEVDESSQRVFNLLVNLTRRSVFEGPTGEVTSEDSAWWTPSRWNNVNERTLPWLAGIRFSYKVAGNVYSGKYLLPAGYAGYELAAKDGSAWVGKRIKVRYNPAKPEHSAFLQEDGAPGKPHIPVGWDGEPYLVELSLK
jgi:hypothetical protein